MFSTSELSVKYKYCFQSKLNLTQSAHVQKDLAPVTCLHLHLLTLTLIFFFIHTKTIIMSAHPVHILSE